MRTAVTQHPSSQPAMDEVRQEHNQAVRDLNYLLLNRIIAATAATYPVCAMAGTKSKAKTTNATVVLNAGVVNAVGATDNAWTLTGGVLAVSKFRKYLLLVDAADAFTVQASSDAAAAADCLFGGLPANGLTILGVLTVATDATHTFTPATTLLDDAGITATFIDGYDINVPQAAQVTL